MSEVKVMIMMGSPRKNGNTAVLTQQVAEGIRSEGGEFEIVYLHGMKINPCDACDICQSGFEENCIVDDDMTELYPKLRKADALVIAGPVYWFTVSAQTKLFMDRCYALGSPDGYALAGKRIGILLTYGDADPFNSGAGNALRTFQDAYNYIGAEIVGMVYGSASDPGEIRSSRTVMDDALELGRKLVARVKESGSI